MHYNSQKPQLRRASYFTPWTVNTAVEHFGTTPYAINMIGNKKAKFSAFSEYCDFVNIHSPCCLSPYFIYGTLLAGIA
jgi:hypothetical protein